MIVLPLVGVMVAAAQVSSSGLGILSIGFFVIMYAVAGLGLSVGYHRLIAHHAFDTFTAVRYGFAICGTMAGQGLFFNWIADHRIHHALSDATGDPHSPHVHDHDELSGVRGLIHAHVGWMFKPRHGNRDRLIPDLVADQGMVWINRLSVPIALGGIALPGLVVLVVTGNAAWAVDAALWGGLVRMFVLNHTVWCVNSLGHSYGAQNFVSRDESRDQPLLAILAFGDGWHNGHHAFPRSARHGLLRGQLDLAFLVIRAMSRLGLAWNVHLPMRRHVERKLMSASDSERVTWLPD